MKYRLFLFVLIIIFLPIFSASAGTILSTSKYAWSSHVGYINFENVIVSDTLLSGFAWSENTGWIKFNPTNGGVLNDGNGNLSGFAWGEGLGWIDFNNVSISTSTGKFSGVATGDIVGTINFDCPNYCDVRTDWSVSSYNSNVSAAVAVSSGVHSIGSGPQINNKILQHVNVLNNPLEIIPQQSGVLNWNTKIGDIIIDIPINSVSYKTIFVINEEVLDSDNLFLIQGKKDLINGSFYNISAVDEKGNPIHEFVKPIKITLPLSKKQIGVKGIKLYWLNEKNWDWVLIPDAIFMDDKVVFYVNHLTKFAIFANKDIDVVDKNNESSISLPLEKKVEYEKKKSEKVLDYSVRDDKGLFKGYIGLFLLLFIIVMIFWIKVNLFKK